MKANISSSGSNKTLIAVGACTSCCLAPFLIGMLVGIVTVSYLCEVYHKYWSNPFVTAGRYLVSPVVSFIADSEIKKLLSERCGSTISTPYSLIPCGDFEELSQKYLGKYEAEMQGIMRSAGIKFNKGLWCADFTAFIVRQLGHNIDGFNYSHTMNWYYKFKNGTDGWRLLGPGESPQPGDVAMMKDFSHTCMFYQAIDSNNFYCFGGNQGGEKGNRKVTRDSERQFSDFYFGRLPGG